MSPKTGLINAYRPVKSFNVAAAMIHKIKMGGQGEEEIPNSRIPVLAKEYFRSVEK